jgi:hypothetical protein
VFSLTFGVSLVLRPLGVGAPARRQARRNLADPARGRLKWSRPRPARKCLSCQGVDGGHGPVVCTISDVVFGFFAAASALAFGFIIRLAPETNGRSPSCPKPFDSLPSLK